MIRATLERRRELENRNGGHYSLSLLDPAMIDPRFGVNMNSMHV